MRNHPEWTPDDIGSLSLPQIEFALCGPPKPKLPPVAKGAVAWMAAEKRAKRQAAIAAAMRRVNRGV
jgi:hypothetical protein